MRVFLVLSILISTLGATLAPTQEASANSKGSRSKVIDFEDETIEGMNKRPLDSLNQVSEKEKRRRKAHLYRKRGSFKSETAETLRVIKYTQ